MNLTREVSELIGELFVSSVILDDKSTTPAILFNSSLVAKLDISWCSVKYCE